MHPLHLRLADRSLGPIGAAREVAAEIAHDPDAVAVVVDGLAHPDEGVRNRSAWALDVATRSTPSRLAPHADALLAVADADRTGGMLRRLLPRLVSRVPLTPAQARRATGWALGRLDRSRPADQANLLGALAAVAVAHPGLAPGIVPSLHIALDHPAPSVRARAWHLCARLDRHGLPAAP
ncbi:hypothetical protein [Rubrivirga sp. IMCC45206]|uniref:hypothetical protein n=1 Tax=Rubrivirga sp. IMCC45206 TaxID=3391614 RepID=UPI00398FA3BC